VGARCRQVTETTHALRASAEPYESVGARWRQVATAAHTPPPGPRSSSRTSSTGTISDHLVGSSGEVPEAGQRQAEPGAAGAAAGHRRRGSRRRGGGSRGRGPLARRARSRVLPCLPVGRRSPGTPPRAPCSGRRRCAGTPRRRVVRAWRWSTSLTRCSGSSCSRPDGRWGKRAPRARFPHFAAPVL
jgi:hypothetical protein